MSLRKEYDFGDEPFGLIDADRARSLRGSFTACILDFPDLEINSTLEDIYSEVAQEIRPLMANGAHVLVKTMQSTFEIAESAFQKEGFSSPQILIHAYENTYDPWLLFQAKGSKSRYLIPQKEVYVSQEATPAEQEIYIEKEYGYYTPQALLRDFVRMLCPKPKSSQVLVPYFGIGATIAACQAVGVKCLGYEANMASGGDDRFEEARDAISKLAQLKV